ncbi:MAG: hypothetical protein K2X93_03550 [Candidatus Obscuribacterales bacterium]|nr:hypothetical protein [Candidatus Obscuribacterales bacterium]
MTKIFAFPSEDSIPVNSARPFSDATQDATDLREQVSNTLLNEYLQSLPQSLRPSTTAANDRAQVQTAAVETDPRPGSETDGDDQPTPVGDRQPPPKPETININGTEVKIKSVDRGFDSSRIVVIDEDYGVHPKGTKITFYDPVTFPNGKPSQYGQLLALAEHPGGSKVYTKRDGNSVYDLDKPIKTDFAGGQFESKFFEEFPNGTQLWRTTTGTMVEMHAKGSATTDKGKLARIDLSNGTLTYLTEDSKTYSLKEYKGKLELSEMENGKAKKTEVVDRFTETFKPPFNHPFYGTVHSRTRMPGQIKLDLGAKGECTIYSTPEKYDDTRTIHSVIKNAREKTEQSLLSDGSIVHTRTAEDLALKPRDWVKIESKPNREQTIFYKNGDYITKAANGNRIEGYKAGHTTSLTDKVVEVQRTKDKNIYMLSDGGKVEVPLNGAGQIVKTTKDGTPTILKDDSIKEQFTYGHPSAYGNVKGLETRTNGETVYSLADTSEYQKITLLPAARNGFKGFVTLPDGTNRLISETGRIVPSLPLNEKSAREYLDSTVKPKGR